jgi:poly(A) polymerase
MINILNKFFFKQNNKNSIFFGFKKLLKETEIKKIFYAIKNESENNEIRYVGGCVRKIINNETVDDIDLAVNLPPLIVSNILKKNSIKFYDTGLDHGTITAIIKKNKFEITSLRKDIETDGRHAKIKFTNSWADDASRRDFSINAIYADLNGNLYDPYNGKIDIKNGEIKFIGNEEQRIKEDYLRILRYVRFFLNYSKKNHKPKVIKVIKKNLDGLSKISSERLLDEFKKLSNSNGFINLTEDKVSLEIISLIFPQFKNFHYLKKLDKKKLENLDFIILISLLIIDNTDNTDYFLYKFKISNHNKKRILFLNNFFTKDINKNTFSKTSLLKILYLNGRESVLDILNFQIFRTKKYASKFQDLLESFKVQTPPIMPIKADYLIKNHNIPEGRELGIKLKKIEQKWLNDSFRISDTEVAKIILG